MSQITLDLATLAKVNHFITVAVADGVNAGATQLFDAMRLTMEVDKYWNRVLPKDTFDAYLEQYQALGTQDNEAVDMETLLDNMTAAIAVYMYNDFMFTHGMRDFALSDGYAVPLLGWLNKVAPEAMDAYGALTFGMIDHSAWEPEQVAGDGGTVLEVGGPVEVAIGDPDGSDPQEDDADWYFGNPEDRQ